MKRNYFTVVSTQVNVKGFPEPTEVYYLGEKGKELLEQIPNKELVWKDIGKLQRQMHRVIEACHSQLVEICKNRMLSETQKKHPNKNFRSCPIRSLMEDEGFDWQVVIDTFSALVADGKIIDKGKGWFKLKEEAKTK